MARRFERVILGTLMSTIAFILQRRILKAIRARAGSRYSLPQGASSPRAYIARPGRFIGSLLASGCQATFRRVSRIRMRESR